MKRGDIMIEYLSRREFMGKSAVMAGGALGGLMIGRTLVSAETSPASNIEFLESRCNENGQHPKILVTYASRCGSTGGVAGAIAGTFCDAGASVDVVQVENVSDLTRYQAIVIGSAIRSDQWLPEAIDFVKGHREVLKDLPVAYFLTCLTLTRSTKENRKKALGYLGPLRREAPHVVPVDTGLFARAFAYGKLPFMMRMVMKMKMQGTGVTEGDYRDWKSIRSWARGAYPALTEAPGDSVLKAS